MIKIKQIEQRCLSLKQLAKYLGVSPSLVHRDYPKWATEYKIRVYKLPFTTGKRQKILFEKFDIDNKLLPAILINPGK